MHFYSICKGRRKDESGRGSPTRYYRDSIGVLSHRPNCFPHFLTNVPSICSISIAYNSESNAISVCSGNLVSRIKIISNLGNGEKPGTIAIVAGYYCTALTAFPNFVTNLPSICSISIAYNSKSNVISVCNVDLVSRIKIISNWENGEKPGTIAIAGRTARRLANCFSPFLDEFTLYLFHFNCI